MAGQQVSRPAGWPGPVSGSAGRRGSPCSRSAVGRPQGSPRPSAPVAPRPPRTTDPAPLRSGTTPVTPSHHTCHSLPPPPRQGAPLRVDDGGGARWACSPQCPSTVGSPPWLSSPPHCPETATARWNSSVRSPERCLPYRGAARRHGCRRTDRRRPGQRGNREEALSQWQQCILQHEAEYEGEGGVRDPAADAGPSAAHRPPDHRPDRPPDHRPAGSPPRIAALPDHRPAESSARRITAPLPQISRVRSDGPGAVG